MELRRGLRALVALFQLDAHGAFDVVRRQKETDRHGQGDARAIAERGGLRQPLGAVALGAVGVEHRRGDQQRAARVFVVRM